jgi:acetyltransferase-like isoleucine patch superfamily enzyme
MTISMRTASPARRLRRSPYALAAAEFLANFVLSVPSRRLRTAFVRSVLRWPMGEDVHIGRSVKLQHIRGIEIGSRVFIHRHTELDLRGGIVIGSDVAISPKCCILTADHDPDSPSREYRERPVVIGDRAWLGTGATLLPGTSVGTGSVVGSNAVAHGSLAEFGLYVGNPAERIRDRATGAQSRLAGYMGPLQ